jgi:hypothetical protein
MNFKQWLTEGESEEKLGSLSTSSQMGTGYNDNPVQPDLSKSNRKFTKRRHRGTIKIVEKNMPPLVYKGLISS